MAEDLVLEEDLLDDLLRAAHEVRTPERARGLEVGPAHGRPASLPSDLGHHRVELRPGRIGRLLRGVRDEPVRVDAQGRSCVPGLEGSAPVDLGERGEPLRHPADDRERHREAERPGAGSGSGVASDRDPDRERVLRRPRVDARVVEWCAKAAGPGDVLRLAEAEQQVELLGEQLVVVGKVVAEEREGLDERATTGHDLGATTGEQVEGRELLEDPYRIVRAEHGDGAAEPDPRRSLGSCGERHDRRRDGEVRPVVLADREDVEADLVCERRLLHQVAQAQGG